MADTLVFEEIEYPGKNPLKNAGWERFCNEYLKDLNTTKAAIRAGYSEKTASQIGWQLLNQPEYKEVQIRVEHLKKVRAESVKIDQDWILKHLKIITEARIEDFVELVTEIKLISQGQGKKRRPIEHQVLRWKDFTKLSEDQKGAIQSIKQGQHGIEIKLFDKSWSLDMVSKHIGFYEKDNAQKINENPVAMYIPENGRDKKVPEELQPKE